MPLVTALVREANARHKFLFLLGLLPIEDCGVTHKPDRSTRQPVEALPTHRADTQSPLRNRSCSRFLRPCKNSHRISTAESIARPTSRYNKKIVVNIAIYWSLFRSVGATSAL